MSTHEELQAQIAANAGCATSMPQYQCHKKVWALKIKEVCTLGVLGGATILIPSEYGYGPFEVSNEYMAKHKPEAGGYFVVYDDGYQSFSPAKAFESGYSKI